MTYPDPRLTRVVVLRDPSGDRMAVRVPPGHHAPIHVFPMDPAGRRGIKCALSYVPSGDPDVYVLAEEMLVDLSGGKPVVLVALRVEEEAL